MYKRICLIVLDSVGIGAMPDAADYGDAGAHTLGNIKKTVGDLALPNLYAMGLGNITNARLPKAAVPTASYGRMAMKTRAKDTTSGHWELAGLVMEPPFATFEKFPEALLCGWLSRAGRETKWLGNHAASGTQIIDELGSTHIQTGAPIVYTSADSVFQVAAHEGIIPLAEQYRLCEIARELLVGEYFVGRVIARPFIGEPGGFSRTQNRRDYAVPPVGETILDALAAQGKKTLGIGKIEDIFCHRGVAYANHTKNNTQGIDATIDALKNDLDAALIFTNLVDFDMLYGHRSDPVGYAKALAYFDTRLPEILAALREDDLLILTADHGCDPTTDHTDHTREYVPVLAYAKNSRAVNLGTRDTFADVGATIYEILCDDRWSIGASFLGDVMPLH